ncbi:lipase 3-like [Episyrphus balteatus]|uniref:lipase 3-like n=1 Tax=Episyrphus balteatus TaxID=286459 RepID=UPI0024851041|nr:lipase 3-like [Episyrphus balteatus]
MFALALVFGGLIIGSASALSLKTTAERIKEHNYPVESHEVQTSDGYILTIFRIPYSPKLMNQNDTKPVAFLQHGLLSSSDAWILNGPDNALAFLLADAGYDVWLGNTRGNAYSMRHLTITNLLLPSFWDFTWNEMAVVDLPTMLDYVLLKSNQKALHYVGHSQGTTIFFVLMSEMPEYNAKIKTAHMLAPVVYMKNMKSRIVNLVGPMLGSPNLLAEVIGNTALGMSNDFIEKISSEACKSELLKPMCKNILFLLTGWDLKFCNMTLLPAIMETHPSPSSCGQAIHYVQEHNSGTWSKYDYGFIGNYMKYNQLTPPCYSEKNVVAPVRLYYSDNDDFAAVEDVQKLISLLPNVVDSVRVPYPEFTHLDFLWATEVKTLLFDRIIEAANYYEKTGQQLQAPNQELVVPDDLN